MHAVEKDLAACGVHQIGRATDVDERAERIRRHGAREQARLRRNQLRQVFQIEVAVIAQPPPAKAGAERCEREPGSNVCFVVEVGDDDLVALAQGLADGEADQADERGRVQAERDLVRIAGIDQGPDAGPRLRQESSSTAMLCE